MVKKATKKKRATRRAPAAAVATQTQVQDWYDRLTDVEAALVNMASGPSAHVQIGQQRESLAAQLAAIRDEIDAALTRAG